jgi:hypothetical protein
MGGGLMQLVAYGAQDVYLTGNPQITFFKVVYRRHTNFSMECIQQTWSGSEIADGRCVATISRNGDLVHKMHLQLNVAATIRRRAISDLIVDAEVEIGGQSVDKQSGAFMQAWNELTHTCGIDENTHDAGTLFQKMSGSSSFSSQSRFVPLNFWFCKNAGLALPLIALQYHEVKVILNHNLTTAYGDFITDNRLWVDYIYLDTDERRRFAQVSHEYLIEQVQEQTLQTGDGDHDLRFNHPVKELIWFATGPVSPGVFSPTATLPVVEHSDLAAATYTLKLNGHDRFSARPHTYFSRVQVYQHHSGDGGDNSFYKFANDALEHGFFGVDTQSIIGLISDSICVYSFALNPEEHQPSGTCNFSRIDTAVLNTSAVVVDNLDNDAVSGNGAAVAANIPQVPRIVAINYNVLRIMSGMGGLAYSN